MPSLSFFTNRILLLINDVGVHYVVMPRSQDVRRKGISVRIRLDDQNDYHLLASALGNIPVARLLVLLISEVVLIWAKKEAPALPFGSLIVAIQRNKDLANICRRISARESGGMAHGRSQSLWLAFKDTERRSLRGIWEALHWSEGKLMLTCLADAMMLGGLEGLATKAPVVPTLYRAISVSGSQVEAEVLSEVNPLLERARRERKRSEKAMEEKAPVKGADPSSRNKDKSPTNGDGTPRFSLGRKTDGDPAVVDLSDPSSCNGLIVGTSGSGKTELLRSIVANIIARNNPATLRVALFEAGTLNFDPINESRYLLHPVITNVPDAIRFLANIVNQIEERYELLSHRKPSSIKNNWHWQILGLPRYVFIFDNLDALLSWDRSSKNPFEEVLIRIATTGPAVGMHLLATAQRAADDIIARRIKDHFPLRICLRVGSTAESLAVIGTPGGEGLQEPGDLLYNSGSEVVNARFVVPSPDELLELCFLIK